MHSQHVGIAFPRGMRKLVCAASERKASQPLKRKRCLAALGRASQALPLQFLQGWAASQAPGPFPAKSHNNEEQPEALDVQCSIVACVRQGCGCYDARFLLAGVPVGCLRVCLLACLLACLIACLPACLLVCLLAQVRNRGFACVRKVDARFLFACVPLGCLFACLLACLLACLRE